jgi:hypothetical protein
LSIKLKSIDLRDIFGIQNKSLLSISHVFASGILIFSLVSLGLLQPQPQQLHQQGAMAQEWYSDMNLCVNPDDKLKYTGPGISIRYPCDWRELSPDRIAQQGMDPGNLVIALVSPQTSETDPFTETLGIYATRIADPFNTQLESVVNERISDLQANEAGFALTGLTPITISDGKPAYVISYTTTDPNAGTLQQVDILTLDGDEVYRMGFASTPQEFDSYLPVVQWMLSSDSLLFFNLQAYLTPGGVPGSNYSPNSQPSDLGNNEDARFQGTPQSGPSDLGNSDMTDPNSNLTYGGTPQSGLSDLGNENVTGPSNIEDTLNIISQALNGTD